MSTKKRTKKYSSRVKDPNRPTGQGNALGYVTFSMKTEEKALNDKFENWMRNLTIAVSMFEANEAIPTAFEHLTYACLRMRWLDANIGLPFEGPEVLKDGIAAINAVHRRLITWEKLEMTKSECAKAKALVDYMKKYYGQFLVIDIDKATKWANIQLKSCTKAVLNKTPEYIKE